MKKHEPKTRIEVAGRYHAKTHCSPRIAGNHVVTGGFGNGREQHFDVDDLFPEEDADGSSVAEWLGPLPW